MPFPLVANQPHRPSASILRCCGGEPDDGIERRGRNKGRLAASSPSSPNRVAADQGREYCGGRGTGTPAGGEIWASLPPSTQSISSRRCQTAVPVLRRSRWISETPSHRTCSQSGTGAQRRPPRLPPSTVDAGSRPPATGEASGHRSLRTVVSPRRISIQTADIRSNGRGCLQTAVNKIFILHSHLDLDAAPASGPELSDSGSRADHFRVFVCPRPRAPTPWYLPVLLQQQSRD
ncbi:uncharacterized protein LOC120654775 [Panicum virgatum]|uniref:Uncharacterized protein n=1 Tax=Panicum virgatum TaxID=38727 RepID=A0A8T0WUI7_PANVG|nr:uncharacterized protein LOC120654775 [Panicum virgatum]KAG2648794.1 hypothetical protein PVAP13_1NG065766 [Panicum virgatum]